MFRIVATAAAAWCCADRRFIRGSAGAGHDTAGDTTSTTPTAPPQRNGNPPAAPSTSTGNGNWYIGGPVTTAVTASDDVGVTSLQYSIDDGATWVDLPVTGGNAARRHR